MAMVRALIVDDDEGVRLLLSINLLARRVEIVGEAADGHAAVEQARELRPDLIVMDLMMPMMDGAEATLIIKKELPDVIVIGFSAADGHGVARMLRAGATGVFSKDRLPEMLATLDTLFHRA